MNILERGKNEETQMQENNCEKNSQTNKKTSQVWKTHGERHDGDKMKYSKAWKNQIEREARGVMSAGASIWRKHGWEDGDMVNKNIFEQDLKKKLGKKKISPIVADILEDANWHTQNSVLENAKMFKGKAYAPRLYRKYRQLGGRTWNL
jgi:hypothetical protein